MIRQYTPKDFNSLYTYIYLFKDKVYFTEDKKKKIVDSPSLLKKFLRGCETVYLDFEGTSVVGAVFIWRAFNPNNPDQKKRLYLKFLSPLRHNKKLLKYVLWHDKRELNVKVPKNSKFLEDLRKHKFFVLYEKNNTLVLRRRVYNVSNANKHNNKS